MKFRILAAAALMSAPFVLSNAHTANACPPGLAKKDPPCVPPGQARHMRYLDDYARYSLPGLPYGQRYVIVEDQIAIIDEETYEILQFIRAFAALTD
jgi:hypothetical protein